MSVSVSPSIFDKLERVVGRRVLVVLDKDFGFEGSLSALSEEPPGIWLSDADAVVLRATIANPVPQIIGREDKSEIFIHLNSVLRIEVLHSK